MQSTQLYDPCGSMTLGLQYGLWSPPISGASAQPLVVPGAMDIDILAVVRPRTQFRPGGHPGHECQWSSLIPGCSMSLGYQHSHRRWARPQTSVWPLVVVTWIMDVNTDPSCGRTMDSDMVPSSSHGMDATKAPGDRQHRQLRSTSLQLQGHPRIPIWPQVGTQTQDSHPILDGNRCLEYQHRLGLWQATDKDRGLSSSPGMSQRCSWEAGLPHQPILHCLCLYRSASLHRT